MEGWFEPLPGNRNDRTYYANFPIIKGSTCDITGQYNPDDPEDQEKNIFHCGNSSNDQLARVVLGVLKNDGSPQKPEYTLDYPLVWFFLGPKLVGGKDDHGTFYESIPENQPLVIRVCVYNFPSSIESLDLEIFHENLIGCDNYGFTLDVKHNDVNELHSPIKDFEMPELESHEVDKLMRLQR